MNKQGKESLFVTLVSIIFAVFIGIVLFTNYEPTRKIISDAIGNVLTFLFIVAVIGIIVGIIWLFYYFSNQ